MANLSLDGKFGNLHFSVLKKSRRLPTKIVELYFAFYMVCGISFAFYIVSMNVGEEPEQKRN